MEATAVVVCGVVMVQPLRKKWSVVAEDVFWSNECEEAKCGKMGQSNKRTIYEVKSGGKISSFVHSPMIEGLVMGVAMFCEYHCAHININLKGQLRFSPSPNPKFLVPHLKSTRR